MYGVGLGAILPLIELFPADELERLLTRIATWVEMSFVFPQKAYRKPDLRT